ncbi:MAG: DnaJ domain-containing protein, partial [bacterium]|nr:DnaJ domain-containing protein [bacterium]
MPDYYDSLGIKKDASSDDIRRAYRKLAQQHHPDKTGGGDDKKFREINEAYQVLSDDSKRAHYDRFGTAFSDAGNGGADPFSDFGRGFGGFSWQNGQDMSGFDFGDIFSDIFGFNAGSNRASHRARGVDLEMNVLISFHDAVFGTEKEVTLQKKDICPVCGGSGAQPGTKLKT